MLHIDHDSRAHRFSTKLEGQTGLLDYELDGASMSIMHVRVARPIEGRGVAAALMQNALKVAATNGWTVKPVCGYAVAYMKRHPTERTDRHLEELLDEALDESYPASDPPAVGHVD
jgi:uncharacterized protein